MRLCAGLALLSSAASGAPENAPATMTHMVVRLMGPGIRPNSFAALPKTIYEASPHYARIEDPPDARQQIQKLTVIAEPDAYSVNLIGKKGTHVKDTGSDSGNDLHLPIVLPFDPKHRLGVLDKIEFGTEVEFFTDAGATREAGPLINAKPTDALRLNTPLGPAVLVLRGGTQTPVTFSWPSKEGTYKYEYTQYEDVPFDPKLFVRPAGITWRELKPDDTHEPG